MTFFALTYILCCCTLNVVLGAYVAILLGYGPETPGEAVRMLIRLFRLEPYIERVRPHILPIIYRILKLLNRLPWFNFDIPEKEIPKEPGQEEKPMFTSEELSAMLKKVEAVDVNSFFDDYNEEIEEISPMQELFDDDLADMLMESGTEAWLMTDKKVETSILKLNTVMMKSGRTAARLDKVLRDARGKANTEIVESSRDTLLDDCNLYLESQAGITEEIQKQIDEFGELRFIAEEIEYSNMEQAAQIETTVSNLARLNTSDPEEGVNDLIKELGKLRVARHSLRDEQEKAFLTVSRYEKRLETISQSLFYDEMIGIRGRIGLEVAVFYWWKMNRNQQRNLTFALIDFVGFGSLNDEHGILVCDALLKYFGRDLEKKFDPQDIVAVYSGNCFMVATVNLGVRKTITEIEKVRQSLERTEFTFDENEHQFSAKVTCAITEVTLEQSYADLFQTLEKTMGTAKKEGRNHTYHLDPNMLDPTPEHVAPPDFGAEYLTVDLDPFMDQSSP